MALVEQLDYGWWYVQLAATIVAWIFAIIHSYDFKQNLFHSVVSVFLRLCGIDKSDRMVACPNFMDNGRD